MEIIVKSNLKSVRNAKGISVRKLAELSGCSNSYISDIENGYANPTIYIICVLAAALEVRPEELFSYEVIG